jgi:hypothetical protein
MLRYLPDKIFQDQKVLDFLVLSNNFFKTISPNGLFYGVNTIYFLHFDNNQLSSFDADLKIMTTDLPNNKLKSYEFNINSILQLNLNDNIYLKSIEFKGSLNTWPKSLFLRNTSSKLINNDLNFTYFKLINIELLDLSLNMINETLILANGFDLSNFKKIFLENTGLNFTPNILKNISGLISLDLSFKTVNYDQINVFKTNPISKMTYLNLAGTGVDNFILDNQVKLILFSRLEMLNLSFNRILTIKSNYFPVLLRNLYLSHNNLSIIESK